MNDTTFQGDGKIVFVPVVVNAKQHPQTNADRIRAMSDEELAEWVNFHTDCENCPNRKCEEPYTINPDSCVKSLLAWFKSPVEVDNGIYYGSGGRG